VELTKANESFRELHLGFQDFGDLDTVSHYLVQYEVPGQASRAGAKLETPNTGRKVPGRNSTLACLVPLVRCSAIESSRDLTTYGVFRCLDAKMSQLTSKNTSPGANSSEYFMDRQVHNEIVRPSPRVIVSYEAFVALIFN